MEKVPKFTGVFFRESTERRFQGKADRCFYITYPDQSGKKVREKVGWISEGYTAALAQQIRAERVRAIRHGDELPRDKKAIPTFGEVWEKYYEWAKSNKASHQSDLARYKQHLKATLDDKRLSEVTPLLLEGIKSHMKAAGLSPQSVKHVLALIRRIYNKSIEWDLFQGPNPILKVKSPSTEMAKRSRFLTYEEASQLLQGVHLHSQQLYEICLLSLHSGMRAGEIFALRWGDVDIDHGVVHIKGKMGIPREGYLGETLLEMFRAKRPEGYQPQDLVFVSQWGKQIKSVSGTYDKVVEELGFNEGVGDRVHKVVFHTLRHTFASWLALRGTPILTIRELMGHKRIEMTMRYAHLIPDHKREAVNGLEEEFRKSKRDRAITNPEEAGQSEKRKSS